MNTTIARLGRRLRLGVVGGGPGSFIGAVHRTAARLDDHFEVVAAVLSRNPERSRAAARAIGIADERAYGDHAELLAKEAERPDGIDALAIMTPNREHHPVARDALARGLDVICDKPLTTTLEDALDLVRRVRDSGLVFCTTYNYTGYPMVRHARAMVRSGALGTVRQLHVE
jgi:predicted dehydrogenase